MKSNLSTICYYVKEKVEVSLLNKKNYISTENMLPNKEGIKEAASLPDVQYVCAFKKGDVLVSNIRPYFKKIWYAEFDGGCSNDVLVFRAKEKELSRFLYFALSNDEFFSYSMATAKGTKMPRGDKKALMDYQIEDMDHKIKIKVSKILSSIENKIAINKKINDNLVA